MSFETTPLSGAACKRRCVGCDEHVLDSSDVEPATININPESVEGCYRRSRSF